MPGNSEDDAPAEAIDQIVEICNVDREDAHRVLRECKMDVQVAIDRFLSGAEDGWSEVTTRKKPVEKRSSNRERSGNQKGGSHASYDRAPTGPGTSTSGGGGRDNYRGVQGSRGGRGRRPKSGYSNANRGDRDTVSGRKPSDEPEPAWANAKADSYWDVSQSNQKLREWALPGRTPAGIQPESSDGLQDGGWGPSPGGKIEDSWSKQDDLVPTQPAASWGLPEEETSTVAKPTSAVGGSSAAGAMEDSSSALTDSANSRVPVNTISTIESRPAGKRELNFRAAVAGGASHAVKKKIPEEAGPIAPSAEHGGQLGLNATAPLSRPPLTGETAPKAADPMPEEPLDRGELKSTKGVLAESTLPAEVTGDQSGLISSWAPLPRGAKADSKAIPPEGETPEMLPTKAKDDAHHKAPLNPLGVDQLGLQFGSFALNGEDASGALKGGPKVAEGEWTTEAPIKPEPPAGPTGSRQYNGVEEMSVPVKPSTTASTFEEQTSDKPRDESGTGSMYAHGDRYSMQGPPQPYGMMPIQYAQYEPQTNARGGVPSPQMQSFYDPSVIGMVPSPTYRDEKVASARSDDRTSSRGGRGAAGKHEHQDGRHFNPYMMAPGFAPYPSVYAFPHSPYPGTAMGPPGTYPQYANAAPPPNQGSGRVDGLEEGGYGHGHSEGPDNAMYQPVFLGVPMMPDMQQQQGGHRQNSQLVQGSQGGSKESDHYKHRSVAAAAPGQAYIPEYASQQNVEWSKAGVSEKLDPSSGTTFGSAHDPKGFGAGQLQTDSHDQRAQMLGRDMNQAYSGNVEGGHLHASGPAPPPPGDSHAAPEQTHGEGEDVSTGYYQSTRNGQHPYFPAYS
mmetsp:Transcript_26993/g.104963  ORF Transcript_26993/g.104963 Transcript_26993/m.104963 type:complete len:843 (-) Transcript_26993:504-3032(-)|eukprot:CAMPEP_0113957602 /NCGR_PEP_ID=MMETSP0011_2-20120614/2872_1 /TAXON_ID=101924 /ORGANISM="Rhodosorus marinus" /LENGTH=842 /DNA_ID=CAMNT_0000968205 /DNA_START=155 /DNA_END=2683 /DNA_ORIENTATION=- /assembly_acc=CAM_ASM_000156